MKSIKYSVLLLGMILTANFINGQQPKDFVVELTTLINEEPPSISFKWNEISQGVASINIYRKSKEATSWGRAIVTLPGNAKGYTDNNVETGVEYEYKIMRASWFTEFFYDYYNEYSQKNPTNLEELQEYWEYYGYPRRNKPIITYVSAGIRITEVENRGKIILLVDSSFVGTLRNELAMFETDLIGDGWQVLRKDVSRNASVKYIKSIIKGFYYSDTVNVKTVILFGHIAIPYSGCQAYDGHIPEEGGAWQADLYYGSMNEELWKDESVNIINNVSSENSNIPGDGKFDLTVLPPNEKIVLQIGRIDLFDMPAFPESESELLRKYLNKNHAFRHKIYSPKLQALIDDNFGWKEGVAWSISEWRNFTSLLNASNVGTGDYFPDMRVDSYMWSYGSGPGGASRRISCSGVGSTNDFASQSLKNVFTCIFGSGLGNWDWPNHYLRAPLASDSWILTSCWTGVPFFILHHMGMGETIGYSLKRTQNNAETYDFNYFNKCIHVGMHGDPTLRMHIVCPVNSLQSAVTKDSSIMLAWKPADDSILGYHVYKLDTVLNLYARITSIPVTDTWFEDTLPVADKNYYMVKAYQLTKSASGSYYNLSQGAFDTIEFALQTTAPVTGIELALDPENILPLMIYESFSINANVLPENATNKLLKWSIENNSANGKFDVQGNILSDKGGTLTIKAEALDGSGITGSLEITIDSIPDAAGTILGYESLCRDNSKKLYKVPEIRGATSYIWMFPGGVTDTTSSNEIIYVIDDNASSGDIRVKGYNPFATGSESSLAITVNEIPPKPVITFDGSVLHSNAPLGNQWYLNIEKIEGAADSIYVPVENGYYQLKVTLNNCSSNFSLPEYVQLTDLNLVNFANGILIYPNPSPKYINIEIENPKNAFIEIYNVSGRLIFSKELNSKVEKIDVSDFPKGIYIVKVMQNSTVYYGKAIVR